MVEDETRSAVETEFGRVYCGRRILRGEIGDEVRNRIERWKATVESAQRTTIYVSNSIACLIGGDWYRRRGIAEQWAAVQAVLSCFRAALRLELSASQSLPRSGRHRTAVEEPQDV